MELEKHNSLINLTGFWVQGIFFWKLDFWTKMVKNRILMRIMLFDGKIFYSNPSGLKKPSFVFFSVWWIFCENWFEAAGECRSGLKFTQ